MSTSDGQIQTQTGQEVKGEADLKGHRHKEGQVQVISKQDN